MDEVPKLQDDESFYAEVRRKVLVGCGALCDDTIIGAPGPFFNFVQKPVDCRALFSNTDNDAPSPRWPPPKGMPAVMKDDFTMHGQAEIMYQYEQNKYAGGQAAENVWTKEASTGKWRRPKRARPRGRMVCRRRRT